MLHLRCEYRCRRRSRQKTLTISRRSSVFTGDRMASFKRLKQTRVKLIYSAKHLAVVGKKPRFRLDRYSPCVEKTFLES